MIILFLLLFLSQTISGTDRISQLIAKNELDEAAELLEEKVSGDSKTEDLLLLMHVYHQLMNPGAVQQLWNEHQTGLESEGRALYYTGIAAYRTGNSSVAVDLLKRAKSGVSQQIPALIALARIYEENRNAQEALLTYRELVRLQPDNMQFQIMEGKFLMRTDAYEEAIVVLSKVLRKAPQNANALYLLAQSLMATEQYNEALKIAEQGLEHFPEHTPILNVAARIHYRLKQYGKALQLWEKIYSTGNGNVITYRNIALSYYAINQNDKALEWFIKVLDEDPMDMNALFYAAVIYRDKEDFIRAEQLLDLLIETQSDDFFRDSLIQRAITREKMERYTDSIKDYRLAGKLQPDYAVSWYFKAVVYDHRLNNPAAAKEKYTTFLEHPDIDQNLRDYARSRVRVLTEEMFFRGEGSE